MDHTYTGARALPKHWSRDWAKEICDVQEMSNTLNGIMDDFYKREEQKLENLFKVATPCIFDAPRTLPDILNTTSEGWVSYYKPQQTPAWQMFTPIKVVYNNPYTIVTWLDGTVTKSICSKDDTYSEEQGFIVCMLKRIKLNGDQIHAILNPPTVIRV